MRANVLRVLRWELPDDPPNSDVGGIGLHVPADPVPERPRFTCDLDARFLRGDRRRFIRLLAPLGYVRTNGVEHIVPAGFECDGGSIPRAFWQLIGHPLDGQYVRSCVTHDWLCSAARGKNGVVEVLPGEWKPATRAHADSVFLEALRCEQLPGWKARAMYAGVRVGAIWKR
jgi:hypothetical protein